MKFSEDDPDSEVSITFTVVFKRKKTWFWSLYEECMRNLKIKNSIIKSKRLDGQASIELYCNQDDINVKKELDNLNKLHDKFNIFHCDFDRFFVTQIISVNKKHHSTYHFLSNRLWGKEKENV